MERRQLKFQSNGQKYQDDTKDSPISGVKRKAQKSVKFQIKEDKVIEVYFTHWQELENHIRVQQWQEQGKQDRCESEHAKFIGGEDHNFRHGAENQSHNNYVISGTRPTVSSLAGA